MDFDDIKYKGIKINANKNIFDRRRKQQQLMYHRKCIMCLERNGDK